MTEKRRPWWAAALIGGAAAGATIAGLLGRSAHADKVADDERLMRIEAKVNDIGERVARIEGRLERK